MSKEAKTAVEKYREKQRHVISRKEYVARKLAMMAALLLVTLVFELLLLGPSADKDTWASALFWGGAFWVSIGTLLGMGSADSQTLSGTSPVVLGTATTILSRNRLTDRNKQLALMLVMMIVGAILIASSYIMIHGL